MFISEDKFSDSAVKCCRTCVEYKPLEHFSKDATKKDGKNTQCKSCYSEYHGANHARINARRKALHVRYSERSKAYSKEWAKANPEKVKNKSLAKYGLDLDGFNCLVELQHGLCKICECELIIGKHSHVDHDHDTGEVRGILCQNCNTKLGWYEKHTGSIHRYLKKEYLNGS